MMATMNRDDARHRLREFLNPEDATPAVFRHPSVLHPLPAGDLAVIITRLREDLGLDFPEPIPTPADLVDLESVTPDQARAIVDLLRLHLNGFEQRQGTSLLQRHDGRESTLTELELHLKLVERYRAAERFFAAVAASDIPAILK